MQPLPLHRMTTHPGEMLAEEFMAPLELDAQAIACAGGLQVEHVSEIIGKVRDINEHIAIGLARATGMPADFWLGLQADHNASVALQKARRD